MNISSNKISFKCLKKKSFKRTFSSVKECQRSKSRLSKSQLELLNIYQNLSHGIGYTNVRQDVVAKMLSHNLGRKNIYHVRTIQRYNEILRSLGFLSWEISTVKMDGKFVSQCRYRVHMSKSMYFQVFKNKQLGIKLNVDLGSSKDLSLGSSKDLSQNNTNRKCCPSNSKYIYIYSSGIGNRENTQKNVIVNKKNGSLPLNLTKKEGIQEMVEKVCPYCKINMYRYQGKFGEFLGCPNKKDGCRYKINVDYPFENVVPTTTSLKLRGTDLKKGSGANIQQKNRNESGRNSNEPVRNWSKIREETEEFCSKSRDRFEKSKDVDVDPFAMFMAAMASRKGLH